jgi:bifunctional DNA-binding transcriptional regulator/antitoxin component of YhaV-PrlF toxin-antitoxin module
MPRLVKGGKWVYGLSRIGPAGTIVIPPEAIKEYGYGEHDKVIIMSGSRTSGGFGLTTASNLEKSQLAALLEGLHELSSYRIPEGKILKKRGRLYCWMAIREGSSITVPLETLSQYGLQAGNLLVVGKGSGLAIAFIARGPLLEEALKHPELEVFGE